MWTPDVMNCKVFIFVLIVGIVHGKDGPHFIGPGTSVTVVEGRDATLVCRVDKLDEYKVAWLRMDTQTILTISTHVITKNQRVGVTRGDAQTYTLVLRNVRPTDGGTYMCQVNTDPMMTQTHQLQVVVPPDIVDSDSSGEFRTREGEGVSLHCSASGTPQPNVTWRREDGAAFSMAGKSVSKWHGEWLNLTEVSRRMSGAYLCIATNGVPPTVSKRIVLHVLCEPSVFAVQKLLGSYVGSSALLQCKIEAFPLPTVHWFFNNHQRLYDEWKYESSIRSKEYLHTASLVVRNVTRDDVGAYRCRVDNALGTADSDVTLYTLVTTTTVAVTSEPSTTSTELTTLATELPMDLYPVDDDHYVVVLSQHQMQSPDQPDHWTSWSSGATPGSNILSISAVLVVLKAL